MLRQQKSVGSTTEVVSPSKPSFLAQKQKFSSAASSNYNSKRKIDQDSINSKHQRAQMLTAKSMGSVASSAKKQNYKLPVKISDSDKR